LIGGVVAFIVFCAFFISVAYSHWHNYERLAHAGIQTSGTVTAKEPNNHQSIRYEYSVGSTRYTGISAAGFGGLPPFDQIRVGDQIPVSFLPQRPTISLPGDPRDVYMSWSGLLFIVVPGLGLIAGMVTAFRLHVKNRQGSK
jgi:hypothetical protein